MGIAALVAWIVTALGGFFLLAKWVAGGGHRRPSNTKLPPAVVFGHFVLAATGLVLWIVYLLTDNQPVGWIGWIILVPVAALGFVMLVRWIPSVRAQTAAEDGPERSFPVVVVGAHGVLAVTTVVLGILALLSI
jgi:manganese efflux pump family protein